MADGNFDRRILSRMSWPAIFAGTFVFLAIEATFGVLGRAIFGPSNPSTGLSAGAGIWLVILSIIALYFGGRAATALSGTADSHVGMYHGLTTFGVSVFTAVIIATTIARLIIAATVVQLSAARSAGNAIGAATTQGMAGTTAYWLFVALILGMIAAGLGGSQATNRVPQIAGGAETTPIRKVS